MDDHKIIEVNLKMLLSNQNSYKLFKLNIENCRDYVK